MPAASHSQHLEFGLVSSTGSPTGQITAVAIPDFASSNNATLATSVFTFLLPEGTQIVPDIAEIPGQTSLTANSITGIWVGQKISPDQIDSIGGNGDELSLAGVRHDVYQVLLQSQPMVASVAGVAIELFTFQLPAGCGAGFIEVLTNDSPPQQEILETAGANVNNQIAYDADGSVGPNPAADIYIGNDPTSFSIDCTDFLFSDGFETLDVLL